MIVQLAYGHGQLSVELPDRRTTVIEPSHTPGLADERAAVLEALENPIGCAPLRDWIKPGPYPHVFHREPCALITPRDFDLSPYFDVVKLTGLADREIDYRRIRWA